MSIQKNEFKEIAMVESIKELRAICQKPHYKEKGYGNWYVRHIIRDLALYVTRPLLYTSVTANQVTFFSILIGIASAVAFACPTAWGLFLGALLLQFWYLLDHVDGQVARYRKTAGVTGVFFDYITHYTVHSVIFIGLGVGAYFSQGHVFMLVLGAISALFMAFVSMFFDAKWKAFFHWIDFNQWRSIDIVNTKDESSSQSNEKSKNIFKICFIFLCKLTDIHVLMNVLTFASLIGLFVELKFLSLAIQEWFVLFYAIVLPTVFSARCFNLIKNKTLDQEFKDKVKPHV